MFGRWWLRRPVLLGTLAVGVVLAVAACAAGPGLAEGGVDTAAAGFWQGLWHGLISPITFLVGLFTDSVSIYEVHNTGNWYDAGFMIGVSTVFTSLGRGGGKVPRRGSVPKGAVS